MGDGELFKSRALARAVGRLAGCRTQPGQNLVTHHRAAQHFHMVHAVDHGLAVLGKVQVVFGRIVLAQRAAQRAGVELLACVREGRWSRYSA